MSDNYAKKLSKYSIRRLLRVAKLAFPSVTLETKIMITPEGTPYYTLFEDDYNTTLFEFLESDGDQMVPEVKKSHIAIQPYCFCNDRFVTKFSGAYLEKIDILILEQESFEWSRTDEIRSWMFN